MDKRNAQRLLELELGHVVDHGLHAFDVIVYGECGIVVVFEVDEENCADVFGNHKIKGVFPVDIYRQTVVIMALYIIVKGVEQRGIGDVLANGSLIVGIQMLSWS